MVRILFLVGLNPFFGSSASANRWRTIIENLNDYGVKNDLFIVDGYNDLRELRSNGLKSRAGNIDFFYGNCFLHGSLWVRRVNRIISLFARRIICTFQVIYIRWLIKRRRPTAIFFQNSSSINRILQRLLNGSNRWKVITEVNEFPEVCLSKIRDQGVYIDEIVPKIDLFIFMTERLRQYYGTMKLKPSCAILHMPMTVDLKRFRIDGVKAKEPYLMYCGSLDNNKDGVDILIESFCKLGNVYKRHKLYLIGWIYSVFVEKQQSIIRQYGMENRVIYLGAKERDEIPGLLMGAELLCLARPRSKQAEGGFPTKLGEYLATSKPVCVTRTGEIPNYLVDNESAFLADPDSVESFTDALNRALSNPELAIRVGRQGRAVAEQFFNKDAQASLLFNFVSQNLK